MSSASSQLKRSLGYQRIPTDSRPLLAVSARFSHAWHANGTGLHPLNSFRVRGGSSRRDTCGGVYSCLAEHADGADHVAPCQITANCVCFVCSLVCTLLPPSSHGSDNADGYAGREAGLLPSHQLGVLQWPRLRPLGEGPGVLDPLLSDVAGASQGPVDRSPRAASARRRCTSWWW